MPINGVMIDLFERTAWMLSRNYVALVAVLILALLATMLVIAGQRI